MGLKINCEENPVVKKVRETGQSLDEMALPAAS